MIVGAGENPSCGLQEDYVVVRRCERIPSFHNLCLAHPTNEVQISMQRTRSMEHKTNYF